MLKVAWWNDSSDLQQQTMRKWRSRAIPRYFQKPFSRETFHSRDFRQTQCWFFAVPKECRPSSEICILIRPPVFKEQIVRRKSSGAEFHQPGRILARPGARSLRSKLLFLRIRHGIHLHFYAPLGISINLATTGSLDVQHESDLSRNNSSNVKNAIPRFRPHIRSIQFAFY